MFRLIILFQCSSPVINCIAHTLQLVVTDTLKNSWEEQGMVPYITHIRAGRELAKNLRKQNNVAVLAAKGKHQPALDVKTRYIVVVIIIIKYKRGE